MSIDFRARFLLAVAAALVSCNNNTTTAAPVPVRNGDNFRLVDAGVLCARGPTDGNPATPGPRVLPADQPMTLTVSNPGCMSSSCDRDRHASCTANRNGNVITVRSELSWQSTDGPCTEDCGRLAVSCRTEPLPAGSYTVDLGGKTTTVVVGGADNGKCPDVLR